VGISLLYLREGEGEEPALNREGKKKILSVSSDGCESPPPSSETREEGGGKKGKKDSASCSFHEEKGRSALAQERSRRPQNSNLINRWNKKERRKGKEGK